MNIMKKGLLVASAAVLAASIPLSVQASSSVSVSGKVWPKAGFSLNFDTVEFDGTVGEMAKSVYKNNQDTVSTPQIEVRYKDNFNVGVASSELKGTNTKGAVVTLDTKRIRVQAGNNEVVGLTNLSKDILTGTASEGAEKVTENMKIELDLRESVEFTDSIHDIAEETNLSTTITITYNGL
jgi:hypothetical protein